MHRTQLQHPGETPDRPLNWLAPRGADLAVDPISITTDATRTWRAGQLRLTEVIPVSGERHIVMRARFQAGASPRQSHVVSPAAYLRDVSPKGRLGLCAR